jgi:monoamine oxidase
VTRGRPSPTACKSLSSVKSNLPNNPTWRHLRNIPDFDVIILGAGAAGLAAARTLTNAGKQVAVLEARARIGGRIFTAAAAGATGPVTVELGAEFVHGLPPSSWSLIREAGLATSERRGATLCFDGERLHQCEDRQQATSRVLASMTEWLERLAPGTDATFAQFLRAINLKEPEAERAAMYVEGFNAADRNIVGVSSLSRQQQAEDLVQSERIFNIDAGYASLPAYLCGQVEKAGAMLFLNTTVHEISWRGRTVTFRCRGADGCKVEYHAAQAIVTLPLGVLQSGDVQFSPAPQEFMAQVHRMVMGCVCRVTLLFDRRFWLDRGAPNLGFLLAGDPSQHTWWTAAQGGAAAITAWRGGPLAARDCELHAKGQLIPQLLDELAAAFGVPAQQMHAMLLSSHAHDWHSDQFSRGAYSYVPAGAVSASALMSQPVQHTLYFAGEHTDVEGHWGTVHGALNSGLRAAAQVLADSR